MRTEIRPNVINEAKKLSIGTGDEINVGGTIYRGKNPYYSFANGRLIKTRPGIPWVRINAKPHELKRLKKIEKN